MICKVASDKNQRFSRKEKGSGSAHSPSYDRTVKDPLVGTPLVSVKVVCVRAVGDVPHWMLTLQLNVVPISPVLNVVLSVWPTRFLPGPSVRTPEFRVMGENVPSVIVIRTFT